MDYSWSNQELWQIRIGERDLDQFEQPYIGNGILGTRFDKLVVGTGKKPLCTLARDVYDRGRQLRLPAWNHVFLKVGDTAYTPENGTHQLEQVLDLRSGAVTLTDLWQYRPGKSVSVSAEMFIPRTFGHASYLSFQVSGALRAARGGFRLRPDEIPSAGKRRADGILPDGKAGPARCPGHFMEGQRFKNRLADPFQQFH